MRGLAKNVVMIDVREMRRKQPHGAQMDATVRQQLENRGEAPRGSGRFDSIVRSVLGEMEHTRAVREHRRAALTEVQPARIEFSERGDQPARCLPL